MTAITLVLVTKHCTLGEVLSCPPCLFALLFLSLRGCATLCPWNGSSTAAAVTSWLGTEQGARVKEHQWSPNRWYFSFPTSLSDYLPPSHEGNSPTHLHKPENRNMNDLFSLRHSPSLPVLQGMLAAALVTHRAPTSTSNSLNDASCPEISPRSLTPSTPSPSCDRNPHMHPVPGF